MDHLVDQETGPSQEMTLDGLDRDRHPLRKADTSPETGGRDSPVPDGSTLDTILRFYREFQKTWVYRLWTYFLVAVGAGCFIWTFLVVLHHLTGYPKFVERIQQGPPGDLKCDGEYVNEGVGVCSNFAMVSTTDMEATKAAREILRMGGNAFDAAVAAQFVLAVVEPESTGIGGGCFGVLFNSHSQQVYNLDGREEAPEAYNPYTFCKNVECISDPECDCGGPHPWTDRRTGGHSVGVPGVPFAMYRLLTEHGRLDWKTVISPAIRIARNGITMRHHLYANILRNVPRLRLFPASAKLYLNADQTAPRVEVGEMWTNPELADTLELLANDPQGVAIFYNGTIASEIVSAVRAAHFNVTGKHGLMTEDDMAGYRAVYREPTRVKFLDYTVHGMNMPSSGGTSLAMMLNTLEILNIQDLKPHSVPYLKALIEAQDLAFSDRNHYMGDADWMDGVPLDGLLDKDYMGDRITEILKANKAPSIPIAHGSPPGSATLKNLYTMKEIPKHGTTHLSIVDNDRNMVALTTTVESNLGSGVVVPGRGFVLNNELTDFAAVGIVDGKKIANGPEGGKRPRKTAITFPGSAVDETLLKGGKRPRSSMTPTLVFQGKEPFLAIGAPGGSLIIGEVLNALVPILAHHWAVREAISVGRIVSRNDPSLKVRMEARFWNTSTADLPHGHVSENELKAQKLAEMGFPMDKHYGQFGFGFVEAVMIAANGTLIGSADDFRNDGAGALGLNKNTKISNW